MGRALRLVFTNHSDPNVFVARRDDYNGLLSVLTVKPAFDFSSPEIGVRPVCLPKKRSDEYEVKCSQQPQNESINSVFCRAGKCEAKSSLTRFQCYKTHVQARIVENWPSANVRSR